MIGVPYNPAQCCFLLSQSLNANQFDPNVPNTGVTPHNLLWNFVENKLQWVETLVGGIIVQELGATLFPNRKIITVDATYGNNTTAATNPYNTEFAFSDCAAAVATAVAGDLIIVHPGNYTVNQIQKDQVDWYFHNGAIVNTPGHVFQTNGMTFNVYGFGTFIANGISLPAFVISFFSNVNITCSKLIGAATTFAFFQGVYVEINSTCNFTAFDLVDCSVNLGNAFFCENNSKLIVTAPEVRFSWIGYGCGDNSRIIVNVPKTVAYDVIGDFTLFGSTYASIANGVTNAIIKIYGDMDTAKTAPDPGPISRTSGALGIRSSGVDCEIHITGNKSVTQGLRAVYIDTLSAKIFVNTDIEELQGDGVYFKRGKVYLNRRLTTPAAPSIAPGIPVNAIEDGAGLIVLNGAVLINGNGGPSIDGSTLPVPPVNYANYQGVASTAPVGAAEVIGNPLIVSPFVE
jgi:hypothetical protein